MLALLLAAAAGLLGIFGFKAWLSQLTMTDPPAALIAMTTALGLTLLLVLGLVVGAARLLWRVAGRVTQAQRFPPPGQVIVGRTPVLTGGAALRRAAMLRGLAGLLLGLGLLLAGTVGLLLKRLVSGIG
jgi:hypothetical protein